MRVWSASGVHTRSPDLDSGSGSEPDSLWRRSAFSERCRHYHSYYDYLYHYQEYYYVKLTIAPGDRPTTRECVHLVTRGHFQSRDKDGGHAIRSAIVENPMLHANFMALCFIELELLPMEVLHCGNRVFGPLLLL